MFQKAVLSAALLLCLQGKGHAAYTVYVFETGGNVVAQGSGGLNLAGTTLVAGVASTVPLMGPSFGLLYTGPGGNLTRYGGLTGPASFGPSAITSATSATGQLVGIQAASLRLFVPPGYVSGSPLASSATWNAATLATLGATPGTYVWTWAGDTYTVNIGMAPPNVSATPVPTLPAGFWGMIGLSGLVACLGMKRLNRKIPALGRNT